MPTVKKLLPRYVWYDARQNEIFDSMVGPGWRGWVFFRKNRILTMDEITYLGEL